MSGSSTLAAARRAKQLTGGPFVVLDLETTDFSAKRGRIIQIGIVNQDGTVLLDTLVNPGVRIPNSHVHGITDEMVKSAPTFREIYQYVDHFLHHQLVFSYNWQFDNSFISASALRLPMLPPSGMKGECIMTLYGKYCGNWNNRSLNKAAAHFGLQFEGEAHSALTDAKMALAVLKKMADS